MITQRKNLFTPKKGLSAGGTIGALIIIAILLPVLLHIFSGPTRAAETSITQQLLKSQLQQCRYEYDNAKQRGEVMAELDLDEDKCIDALDVCMAWKSDKDSDLDGVPDKCDAVVDSAGNVKDNIKYTQRMLCERAPGTTKWNNDKKICCKDSDGKKFIETFC